MVALRWLDANVEKIMILVCYVTMAGIIFVEVIRRFLFNEQVPWSTTVPIYLFLWIVWLGCTYNVKIRAHLRFRSEEHTSELQSLMRISYAVFCLKQKKDKRTV